MSAIEIPEVGEPLPRIARVKAEEPFFVTVEWSAGNGAGAVETVDLSPDILSYELYRPLREDETLFRTVHVTAFGAAIAWGEDDLIDMPATAVERLAGEVMTNDDFAAFLKRNRLSLDAAAAPLGISRRQVAYYAKAKVVPRHIALACRYLESAGT